MKEFEDKLINALKTNKITNPKEIMDLYRSFEGKLPNNISEASVFINDRKQDIIDRVINSNDSRLYSLSIIPDNLDLTTAFIFSSLDVAAVIIPCNVNIATFITSNSSKSFSNFSGINSRISPDNVSVV